MAESVEDEFDEIEEKLGLVEEKTVDESLTAIRKAIRVEFKIVRNLIGWLIFFSIGILFCFIILLFRV